MSSPESALLLPVNPFEDQFSGSALIAGEVQYPSVLAAGSFVNVTGGKLQIGFNANTANMRIGSNAPRVLIPLTASYNSHYNFYLTALVTLPSQAAGAGGFGGIGIGLVANAASPTSDFLRVIEFYTDGTSVFAPLCAAPMNTDAIAGAATEQTTIPGTPFWLRVVRIDNVIYSEFSTDNTSSSTPPLTGWTRWDDDASLQSRSRWVDNSQSGTSLGTIMIYAHSTSDVASTPAVTFKLESLKITAWPQFSSAVEVQDLVAKTWPGGERVDLSWTNPTGIDEPRYMMVVRSKYGHPEFHLPTRLTPAVVGTGLAPLGDILYSGVPIESFTDILVIPDHMFYYSVFVTRAPEADIMSAHVDMLQYQNYPSETDWGPQVPSSNKVTGLAITDYGSTDEWLYRLFPEHFREMDEQDRVDLGAATGYLQRYALFLQRTADFYRGHLAGYGLLRDSEKAPLGLIGQAADQTSIVDNVLRDFGINPYAQGLDAQGKRRLWQFVIAEIKKKGSLSAIARFVRLVTLWDPITLVEPGVGNTLRFLRTWDGYTTKEEVQITAASLTIVAGSIEGLSGLSPSKYKGGLYLDYFGNVRIIADNTATGVTFVDDTFVAPTEKIFAGTVFAVGAPNDTLHLTALNPPVNDDALNGGTLYGSAGGTGVVVDTINSGLTTASVLIPTGTVAGVAFAFAHSYSGGTYGTRVPNHKFWLFTGEPSWIYEPKSTLSEVGTEFDPFFHLWPGIASYGRGYAYAASDYDVIVYAPPGAAKYVDYVNEKIESNSVCLFAGPGLPDVVPGDYINPNRNTGFWFRITDIIHTTETVYLLNESFNFNFAGWGLSTTGSQAEAKQIGTAVDTYPAPLSTPPRTGSYQALLGNLDYPNAPVGGTSMAYPIDVPVNGTTAFSAYVWRKSSDVIGNDQQACLILDQFASTLVTVFMSCTTDAGWTHFTADLTPYAGRRVFIVFAVVTSNATLPTYMLVDDVTVIQTVPVTKYIVDTLGNLQPSQVSAKGDVSAIAERMTVEHDKQLRALASLVLPWDSRLLIYYR